MACLSQQKQIVRMWYFWHFTVEDCDVGCFTLLMQLHQLADASPLLCFVSASVSVTKPSVLIDYYSCGLQRQRSQMPSWAPLVVAVQHQQVRLKNPLPSSFAPSSALPSVPLLLSGPKCKEWRQEVVSKWFILQMVLSRVAWMRWLGMQVGRGVKGRAQKTEKQPGCDTSGQTPD